MALDKTNASPDAADGGLTQKRRWLVFGSNVAIAIVLATVLAGGAVWLSSVTLRGKTRSDWTATGRFSLSPRTKAAVADLPCEVRLTNLYVTVPEIPASAEQQQRVQDLLGEYAAANPKIAVEAVNPFFDSDAFSTLLARLRKHYEKEAESPKAVLADFDALQKEIGVLLTADAKRLDAAAAAWKDGPPDAVNAFRMISQKWKQFQAVGPIVAQGIAEMTGEQTGLPAYATALTRARDYLGQVADLFGAVPGMFDQIQTMAKGAAMPAEVKDVLAAGKATYEPFQKRINEFEKKAAAVKESDLEAIRRDISQGQAILIESPAAIKVVSFDDVWVRASKSRESEEGEERLFAGEQAVSAALMGICVKTRPAVLFVTAGAPATSQGGPYSEMAGRLKKANFLVEDWDLMRQPDLPQPEGASKIILVLVPPAPPNPQMMMPPPSPEQYRAAIDAVRSGTPAILMGEPSNMMQPPAPYAELYELFGVEARWNATAVRSVLVDPTAGTERAVPQIEVTKYSPFAITAPLGALPTMFLTASPLMIKKDLPAGVTVAALVEMPAGRDTWAETAAFELMRGQAKRSDDDLPGPLPLAVAATRKVGDGEQKAVLFGDADVAQDRVAFYADPLGRMLFPGNTELILNSLLWVSGTEQLISVSPEALQARRIGDLGPWGLPLRVAIIGGLPALVLVIGIAMHFIRRR